MAWRGPTIIDNTSPNPVNYNQEMSECSRDINRSRDIRRDVDSLKNFSISLHDIDVTIFNHLDVRVNPTVVAAGKTEKIPVNYASPERWKSIEDDGYIRDANGKIQCPVLAMRRSTMQRNDNLITFNRHLQYPIMKAFSQKNQYDKFSVMSGFSPVKEIYHVACPDHVIINYDFIVWTDYVEQANAVIEKINWATEDYWGEKHGLKFRTSISDFQFQTEVPADQDRIIRTSFTMMCYAYLLPEAFESNKSIVQKSFTPRKIIVTGETVKSISTDLVLPKLTKLSGNNVPEIDDSNSYPTSESITSTYTNSKLLEYQNNLSEKTGSILLRSDVVGYISGSVSESIVQLNGSLPIFTGISSGSTISIFGSFIGTEVLSSVFILDSAIFSGSGAIISPISGSLISMSSLISGSGNVFFISGSILWSVDQQIGSSVFVVENSTFNSSISTSKYQNLIVTIDGKSIPMAGVEYRTIGSNIILDINNGYIGSLPKQETVAYAYGNIK